MPSEAALIFMLSIIFFGAHFFGMVCLVGFVVYANPGFPKLDYLNFCLAMACVNLVLYGCITISIVKIRIHSINRLTQEITSISGLTLADLVEVAQPEGHIPSASPRTDPVVIAIEMPEFVGIA
jgi:hypothetical protein